MDGDIVRGCCVFKKRTHHPRAVGNDIVTSTLSAMSDPGRACVKRHRWKL